MTVGRRGLFLDPGQQVGQARLAIGRRRLDIQQPGQPAGQVELLLQARDLRARASCPYRCQYNPMNTSLCARYARYTSRGGYGRAPSSNITGDSRSAETRATPPAAPRPAHPAWNSRTPAAAGRESG